MSQNYTNESTIVLFQNDKEGNEKRPDYRGKLYLHGEEYKVAVWKQMRNDGTGQEYLKGKIERFQAGPPAGAGAGAKPFQPPAFSPSNRAPAMPTATDEIPF